MANGLGYKVWTRERLTVADLQGYLQDQVVGQFASVAARDAAITSPTDGMIAYTEDTDEFTYREGGAYWRPLGPKWPVQGASDSLPNTSAGLRAGEFLYSSKFDCVLMYDLTAGGWRQATIVTTDSLATYHANLVARGVTSVHNGFLVFQTATNRLFASTGALLSGGVSGGAWVQIGGAAITSVTSGFPNATGWNYVAGASWVRSVGGGMAQFYVEVTKATSALSVPTNGNVANTTVGGVPSSYVPDVGTVCNSGGTGRACTGALTTAGDLVLCATAPGSDIAVGETISLGGTYRVNNPTV